MECHSTAVIPKAPTLAPQVAVLTPPESPPSKKRKRDFNLAAEIEVDITALEPPSKKALRKARKEGKATPKTTPVDPLERKADTEGKAPNEGSLLVEKPSNRSVYGIWIGNLSWTTTKNELRDFFAENMSDAATSITRLHLPSPSQTTLRNSQQKTKPQNKGFAYINFSTKAALSDALSLSEKLFSGRKVLIKDAKSFEGRPEKSVDEDAKEMDALSRKSPSERIFVGNLRFETTKEEIREHFQKLGVVEDVFLATFEDSGKCKGYGWVTFGKVEAAKTAVRGWVKMVSDAEEEEECVEVVEEMGDMDEDRKEALGYGKKLKRKAKTRKWWVNRLQGRPLRMEFAEGKDVRYKKRYGKGATTTQKKSAGEDSVGERAIAASKEANGGSKAAEKPAQRINTGGYQPKNRVDARSTKPGAALAAAPRLTGGIVESKGKKIIFES